MKAVKILLIAILIMMLFSPALMAFGKFQDYPKDGKFKQIPSSKDYWYFFDNNNWYIKAPDKFQHMMGSYALTRVGSLMMDEYTSAAIVLGLGLYKEYDDGLREGWSPRDLLMDAFGVVAGVANNEKYKLWMDWNGGAIILKFSITLH